jgi:hypothetical protein
MAATYVVIHRAESGGFDVEIVGHDGVRQTKPGFETTEQAEAWIVCDIRAEPYADIQNGRGFRMFWRF